MKERKTSFHRRQPLHLKPTCRRKKRWKKDEKNIEKRGRNASDALTQQHPAYQIGGADARGTLDNLESASIFDILIAVIAIGVASNIVTVDNVFAAIVVDPVERGDIGSIWNAFGNPATGMDGEHAEWREL